MVTEKRLIDIDEAMIALHDEIWWTDSEKAYFRAFLRKQKRLDAVEVVRCKDCKHYMTIHCTCDGCCISDDWYCADGERKDK